MTCVLTIAFCPWPYSSMLREDSHILCFVRVRVCFCVHACMHVEIDTNKYMHAAMKNTPQIQQCVCGVCIFVNTVAPT